MSPSLVLYRRLLTYVRPYWWAFALALIGMVIVAAGDTLMAYMVMPIIQKLQNPDPAMTVQLPLAVVAVFLLRGLGSFMSEYGMAWTGHRVVFDLRREMIDRLLSLPTPYYDAQSSGRLISKFTFDAYQLAAATSSAITTAVRSALTIAGTLGLLFWLNWQLTLVSIVIMPAVAVVIRYFSRRLRRVARDVQQRTGSMSHEIASDLRMRHGDRATARDLLPESGNDAACAAENIAETNDDELCCAVLQALAHHLGQPLRGAHHIGWIYRLVGRHQHEFFDFCDSRGARQHPSAIGVVAHRLPGVGLFHQRHMLVRRGMKDDAGALTR